MATFIKKAWIVATLMATGTAWADGIVVHVMGEPDLVGADAVNVLSFSDATLEAFQADHIDVAALAPASIATTPSTTVVLPVTTLYATPISPGSGIAAINATDSIGGWTLTSMADGKDHAGYSIALSNLTVDLDGQTIQADLTSSTSSQRMVLWRYTTMSGSAPMLDLPFLKEQCWTECQSYTLSGLNFDPTALALISTSLGLTTTEQDALSTIGSVGTFTTVLGVPEPDTSMLMSLGLLGVACAFVRRHHKRQSSEHPRNGAQT
jgi:hypothetical protein